MHIETMDQTGNTLEFRLTGKLTRQDYAEFVPLVEQAVAEHGKVRMLVVMSDFHGWNAGALWEDIKFDLKHFAHIERVAMIGEKKWQEWMAVFCRPFTRAKIKYFNADRVEEAKTWLNAEP